MCCAFLLFLKVVVGIVTGILMSFGVVLVVIGALLLWGLGYIMKSAYPLESLVEEFLKKFNTSTNPSEVMDLLGLNTKIIGTITFAIGIGIVVFSILMIISINACSNKQLTLSMVILLSAILILMVVIWVFYGSNVEYRVLTPFKDFLQTKVVNKYVSINSTNPESVFTNVVQISLQCCGLVNYSDFQTASNFKRSRKILNGTIINMKFPISCCDFNRNFSMLVSSLIACEVHQITGMVKRGCWPMIKYQVQYYLNRIFLSFSITVGIMVGVIVFLLISFFIM